MKVLICAYACVRDPSTNLPGGGDLMAWNMIKRLGWSHDLWVLTARQNRGAIEAKLENDPMPRIRFAYVGLPKWLRFLFRAQGGVQLYAYLWQWRALFAARRLHRRVKFDAFHHLTYENDWMASPTGAFLPVPYLRGPGGGAHRTPREFVKRYPLRGRLWERFRAAGQWVLRRDPVFLLGQQRARAILVCNREALEAIPARWRSKARLFPVNGVSQEVFARRPAQARAEKKFTVLSAGRLVRLKAFDLAIKAFKDFSDRVRESTGDAKLELLLAGEGPERARLEALRHDLGLEGSVTIECWKPRAELWEAMRECDVFLFPSLRDGGGLVVVEAMAAGAPVVCVDLGGPGMHVTDECGFKIKPESPEQVVSGLASALEMLFRNPDLRARMSVAGQNRAAQVYDWDRLAEQMLDVYGTHLGLQPFTGEKAPTASVTCRTLGG